MAHTNSTSSSPTEIASSLRLPELLAPAGNWVCARAAVENGADAIYFGLDQFNARMRADNFTEADLPDLMAFLHRRGVKGYVTLNTLIFTGELAQAERYLRAVMAAGVDAAIVQDVGMCRLIRHLSPDFPIHASTQMTVTSAAGVAFARSLGCNLVVLARECSLREMRAIQNDLRDRALAMPLEVFVHGALCVAYSGQCLTSEALGGRSANRGECAQACRLPYELVVDGVTRDLGDRKYLLSPQDLSGLAVLPELVAAGIVSLKIEGRLKTPEYVAAVTRTYRDALDRLARGEGHGVGDRDRYVLEMAFSRGLSTGWLKGIDNQSLVHARFGKKRGAYLGDVVRVERKGYDRHVVVRLQAPLKAGDGVVFDRGQPAEREEGGRVYGVERRGDEAIVTFGRQDVDLRRVQPGDRLWKTSDPDIDRQVRQTYAGDTPRWQQPIAIEVHGAAGQPLVAIARDRQGHVVRVASAMPLEAAHTQALTGDRLQAQFGRLGNTPFHLETLENHLEGEVLLPLSELNRLRREIVAQLEAQRAQPPRWQLHASATMAELMPALEPARDAPAPQLIVLVRRLDQLQAVLAAELPDLRTIYCEFEDPRAYREAVRRARQAPTRPEIWVAPPRIAKPHETYILQQVRSSNADGYVARNYDHLEFFAGDRRVGDFSFNVANPLTAKYFRETYGLERLTASYDLNIAQLTDLLAHCPPSWFEVTIHQHMPMFHMEHCVFCAFLSSGTDYTNCGRPCEQHQVNLRDRAGAEHILLADAGCRNTVFNGTAQTGAEYVPTLLGLGLRHFRVEFVRESPSQVLFAIARYQQLLRGEISGTQLWRALQRELSLQTQLGVTRGPLEARS